MSWEANPIAPLQGAACFPKFMLVYNKNFFKKKRSMENSGVHVPDSHGKLLYC